MQRTPWRDILTSAQTLHTLRTTKGNPWYMYGRKHGQRSCYRKKVSETNINSSDVHLVLSLMGVGGRKEDER